MSTAVWPMREAIDGALTGDVTFAALIGTRAYDESERPEGATLPFISYGTPTERAFDTFSGDGNDGTAILHLYGANGKVVAAMYGHVNRLLHNKTLVVTGHVALVLRTSLLEIRTDPSGAAHGIVRVSALTQAAA